MTPNPMPKSKPGAAAPGLPAGKSKKLNKSNNPKKPKKPMPRFMVAVLSFFITLLLIAGAGVAVYLNFAGIAQQVIEMIPQYKTAFAELEQKGKDIETRQLELDVGQAKLAADVKALDAKATDLTARETKLAQDLQALQDKTADAETEEVRRKNVIAIYSKLEASAAADMLDKATTLQEVAAILNDLTVAKATEILAAMDAKKAYDITKLMEK